MDDFVELTAALTNFIQNERVRSYNEGVDAERSRCFGVVSDMIEDHELRKSVRERIERGETDEDRRLKEFSERI